MYSVYGALAPDTLPMSHPHDAFLDQLSTLMAHSLPARRPSRSTCGQQRSGLAMRIVKPSSANNSPTGSTSANRKRTAMVEGCTPQRQRQVVDYFGVTHGNDMAMPVKQSGRPLSWHPTSYVQRAPPQPQAQSTWPPPVSSMYADAQDYPSAQRPHFSPATATYSNDTSPSSTFSPLPLFPGHDASCLQGDIWDYSHKATPYYPPYADGRTMSDQAQVFNGAAHQRSVPGDALDWEALIMQRYNTSPTPETFPQMEPTQPMVTTGGIAYEALEKPEEGEILVGMGLYDAPDKFEEDPQLNNYRSTVSSLLGSLLRPREPAGKGLKLEETWEPPTSEDGEDDNDDAAEETPGHDC